MDDRDKAAAAFSTRNAVSVTFSAILLAQLNAIGIGTGIAATTESVARSYTIPVPIGKESRITQDTSAVLVADSGSFKGQLTLTPYEVRRAVSMQVVVSSDPQSSTFPTRLECELRDPTGEQVSTWSVTNASTVSSSDSPPKREAKWSGAIALREGIRFVPGSYRVRCEDEARTRVDGGFRVVRSGPPDLGRLHGYLRRVRVVSQDLNATLVGSGVTVRDASVRKLDLEISLVHGAASESVSVPISCTLKSQFGPTADAFWGKKMKIARGTVVTDHVLDFLAPSGRWTAGEWQFVCDSGGEVFVSETIRIR